MPTSLQINCGSNTAYSPFIADPYWGDSSVTHVGYPGTSSGKSTASAPGPAPSQVYNTLRYQPPGGDIIYSTSFSPGTQVKIRVHIETNNANTYRHSLDVNGTTVIAAFDPRSVVNIDNRIVICEATVTVDGTGTINAKNYANSGEYPYLFAIEFIPIAGLSIDTASPLPGGILGTAYSQTITSSGGSGSVSYSVGSGMPPGLSLSSGGSITGTPTTAGTYTFSVSANDGTSTVSKSFTLVITAAAVVPSSRWSKMGIVPRSNLLAWHALDNAVSAANIDDLSGNNRPLTGSSGLPALQTNILNGLPALYFDGTNQPVKYTASGVVTVKHAFIVAAFYDASFTALQGLLSSVASGSDILVTNASGDTFFNLGYSPFTYKKSDAEYPATAAKAPMSGNFAVLEVILPTGILMDGFQIGQQRAFTDRKFKGWFVEELIYGDVLSSDGRKAVYEYFAYKFHLWRKKSDNLNIFPFDFDRASTLEEEDLAEVSEAEGLRGKDKIVRYLDDNPICSYNLEFAKRRSLEFETTRAFCRQHRLHLPFWLEDCEKNDARKVTRISKISDTSGDFVSQDYGFNVRDY